MHVLNIINHMHKIYLSACESPRNPKANPSRMVKGRQPTNRNPNSISPAITFLPVTVAVILWLNTIKLNLFFDVAKRLHHYQR